ncbi:MAG: sigma-70 family RNA polymerase sigma factor, partial [Thermoguttaceae bacterium]
LQQRVPAADAEDLCQDTFLRAYQGLGQYRSRWPFAAWLFTIARRVSINHYRRPRATIDARALEAAQAADPLPLEIIIAEESRRRLWDLAAQTLSEEQTTALWLFYVEQMPVEQVAWVLGFSRVAVKTMLFRARRRLLPLLREQDVDHSPEPQARRPVHHALGTHRTPHRTAWEAPHV